MTVASLASCIIGASASAAVYTPSQAQLLTLATGFTGGVASNTSSGSGVELNLTLADQSGFSESNGVFSTAATPTDLSAFTSYEVTVTRDAAATNLNSVRIFIKTGPGFTFNAGTAISLPAATATAVSLDLTAVSNLTDVKEVGFQFFGNGGSFTDQLVTIDPVPEPGTLALAGLGGLVLLARRRRA